MPSNLWQAILATLRYVPIRRVLVAVALLAYVVVGVAHVHAEQGVPPTAAQAAAAVDADGDDDTVDVATAADHCHACAPALPAIATSASVFAVAWIERHADAGTYGAPRFLETDAPPPRRLI
jgi:hypothetical protein